MSKTIYMDNLIDFVQLYCIVEKSHVNYVPFPEEKL